MKHALPFSLIVFIAAVAGWVCIFLDDYSEITIKLLLAPVAMTLIYVGSHWRIIKEDLKENNHRAKEDLPLILGLTSASTIPQLIYWLI